MLLTWTPPGVGRNFLTVEIPPKLAKTPLTKAAYLGLLEARLARLLVAEGEDAAAVAEEMAAPDDLRLQGMTPSQMAGVIRGAEAMEGALASGPQINWPVPPTEFLSDPEADSEDEMSLADLMGRLYP